MDNSNLYVIGNGFDIHHSLKSKYSDFKNFMIKNHYFLYEKIEKYYGNSDYWNDLERSLADLDYNYIFDEFSCFLISYGADDWSDADHHNYQYEINNLIRILTDQMLSAFSDWLNQLELDSATSPKGQLDYISPNGFFLNFNYTSTLEKCYDVSTENIKYIHGCINTDGKNIILGHAWNPEERKPLNPKINHEIIEKYVDVDFRITEGNGLIDDYFLRTYKPTRKIIEENKDFFEKISEIKYIYVLGHSISDIDIEYFKKLVASINIKTTEWHVSFYNESEKDHHQKELINIGVPSSLLFLKPINNMPKLTE